MTSLYRFYCWILKVLSHNDFALRPQWTLEICRGSPQWVGLFEAPLDFAPVGNDERVYPGLMTA